MVPCSLELTRVPLLTGSSGQVEGGVRHYSLSSEEGEMSVQTLDSPGGTVGRRRRHSNGGEGRSSIGDRCLSSPTPVDFPLLRKKQLRSRCEANVQT